MLKEFWQKLRFRMIEMSLWLLILVLLLYGCPRP